MLTKRLAYSPPRLRIGGVQIAISSHIRYLGVIQYTRLTFGNQAETVAKKASVSAVALTRLMPNISRPSQMKRRLLSSVVESQLLYAARTRTKLRRPQRVAALKTCRTCRTVSDDVTFLLAGMPPVILGKKVFGKKSPVKKSPVKKPTEKKSYGKKVSCCSINKTILPLYLLF